MVSSRLIGALFLAGFLCYGIGFSLVTSVVGKSDFMESLTAHRIPLVVGALLMLLNMPVDIAKGVLFFPILDRYGRRTALTYLVMISAEAVMLGIGVLFLLVVVPLHGHGADAMFGWLAVDANNLAYQIGEILLGVAGVFLCLRLRRSGLIPPYMAWWGAAGYVILAFGNLAELFALHIGGGPVDPRWAVRGRPRRLADRQRLPARRIRQVASRRLAARDDGAVTAAEYNHTVVRNVVDPNGTIHARRWHILAVLGLSLLLVNIDNMILNVAVKTIQESLGTSQGDMQWAIDSYVVVFAGLLFTWGVLGDRYGRRRALLIGLAIFGVTSALCAFAETPGQLILGRALMGVGGAAVMPQTLSIIANVFESSERGRAISIWAAFTGVAIAVGPATGGLLIEHFWWGSIFLVNVPVVAVALVLVAALVPESRDPHPRRVDPVGVPLSIVGLGLLVYGIIIGGQTADWVGARVLFSIIAGLVVLGLFVLIQRRSAHPTLDLSLFGDARFSAATLAIGLVFFGLTGAYFYLGYYFQVVRGYSALRAGLCLIPVAAALLIAAPRSGRLAQRFGPRAVIGTGLTVVAACFAAHAFLDRTTPVWVVEVLLFAQGTGMGNVFAPATNVIMNAVPRAKAATGSGVNNTVRQVGAALGVAVIGSILSAGYRAHLGSALDALPAPWRGTGVDESVGATLATVDRAAAALDGGRLPPGTAGALSGVRSAATDAFLGAMHLSSLGAAAAALSGSLLVWLFLPARQPTPRPTRDLDDTVRPPGDGAMTAG